MLYVAWFKALVFEQCYGEGKIPDFIRKFSFSPVLPLVFIEKRLRVLI